MIPGLDLVLKPTIVNVRVILVSHTYYLTVCLIKEWPKIPWHHPSVCSGFPKAKHCDDVTVCRDHHILASLRPHAAGFDPKPPSVTHEVTAPLSSRVVRIWLESKKT